MAAKSFLRNVAGRIKMVLGVVTSAGAANDGDIPCLDATGRLDVSVMPSGVGPQTKVITTSEALAAGDLVNIHNSTGEKARKADATAEGKEVHGFVLAGFANATSATVYLGGTLTGLSGMTPGARQYLSAATPGARTETAPSANGNVVQCVGIAISATELDFYPEPPITVVA